MINFVFTVGVEDLRLETSHACRENPSCMTSMTLSFGLQGDFRHAAVNDSLPSAVDYDQLCSAIKKSLLNEHCTHPQAILDAIRTTIYDFSDDITGGYLTLRINCHTPFIIEEALL